MKSGSLKPRFKEIGVLEVSYKIFKEVTSIKNSDRKNIYIFIHIIKYYIDMLIRVKIQLVSLSSETLNFGNNGVNILTVLWVERGWHKNSTWIEYINEGWKTNSKLW